MTKFSHIDILIGRVLYEFLETKRMIRGFLELLK